MSGLIWIWGRDTAISKETGGVTCSSQADRAEQARVMRVSFQLKAVVLLSEIKDKIDLDTVGG